MNIISQFIKAYIDKKFCKHQWKILNKTEKTFGGYNITYTCEKCGKIYTEEVNENLRPGYWYYKK